MAFTLYHLNVHSIRSYKVYKRAIFSCQLDGSKTLNGKNDPLGSHQKSSLRQQRKWAHKTEIWQERWHITKAEKL